MKMVGENHIDINALESNIRFYFETTAQTFVRYNTSVTVTELNPDQNVKYIGLWDAAASNRQKANWAAKKTVVNHQILFGPHAGFVVTNEEPTPQEWTNAIHGVGAAQTTARTAIIRKAQAWAERVQDEFFAMEDQWVRDNAPTDTIIAIHYYHPKYSPDDDGETTVWGGYTNNNWLVVNFGRPHDVHPDARWGEFEGTSYEEGKITIPRITDSTGAINNVRTRVATTHEITHGTRSFFHRANIRNDNPVDPDNDHSSSNTGLMDPTASQFQFNQQECKILKGETR